MDWLVELFTQGSVTQTILLLTLISICGLALGRIKIFGMQFGSSFVFFAAIAAGHFAKRWGIEPNAPMMDLAKNFGLIIFVYTLGLQCGPGFFASLRKGGLKLVLGALIAALLSTAICVLFIYTTDISVPEAVGLLSGSVTSTPSLIAAQQTVLDIDPAAVDAANTIGAAYAVGYPFSVLCVILAVFFLTKVFPKRVAESSGRGNDVYTSALEVRVQNPAVAGKCVRDVVSDSGMHFVISRLWRNGNVEIPMSDTVINEGDHMLLICDKDDFSNISRFFGHEENTDWNRPDIDWNIIDRNLISRHLRVTRDEVSGISLGKLKLRAKFGVNITRINRAGITLVPDANTTLQFGDRLTVVGGEEKIKAMAKFVGNEESRLNEPRLIPILAGLFLGVLLGSVPIAVPGISAPLKLGIAGGPIIMGILMGAFGPRLHITTYTTRAANLMLRQLGITFFLAALGLGVGGNFVETVFSSQGLKWAGMSVVIAIVPLLIIGIINEKWLHLSFPQNLGVVCGSTTSTNALAYANSVLENDNAAAAYATVYPLVTFLRVFIAQTLIMLLA